jgi:hypothetical protein
MHIVISDVYISTTFSSSNPNKCEVEEMKREAWEDYNYGGLGRGLKQTPGKRDAGLRHGA